MKSPLDYGHVSVHELHRALNERPNLRKLRNRIQIHLDIVAHQKYTEGCVLRPGAESCGQCGYVDCLCANGRPGDKEPWA